MKLLLCLVLALQGDVQVRAKTAFDQVKLCSCEKCDCIDCKCSSTGCTCPDCSNKAKSAFAAVKIDCLCQNCDCVDCKCTKEKCECKTCNSFDAVYAKSVRDNQVIVLAVGTPAPKLDGLPWRIIEVKAISGEKPGYIVGVPKDGKLVRVDFAVGTARQRMKLNVLHVLYPLTDGYVECSTCPEGRIKATSYRNPIGHTHTCTSCGESWDHTANSTHKCKNCGGHPPISPYGGYEADAIPKMIRTQSVARQQTVFVSSDCPQAR